MIRHFSPISRESSAPAPSVDFNGTWINDLGSEMDLKVEGGAITGKYRTAVGIPPAEQPDLVGFATEDLISFTVNFGASGSLTSWVGQATIEDKEEVIKTMWLLAENVPDADEPKKLWGAVLTGYNNFRRKKS